MNYYKFRKLCLKRSAVLLGVAALNLSACDRGPRQVKGEPAEGGATVSTSDVLCPTEGSFLGNYSAAGKMMSKWQWSCDEKNRYLVSNGLPNTTVGVFPNPGNENTISKQNIRFSAPLKPKMTDTNTWIGGPGGVGVYTINGVKFDPGTGGSCPDNAKTIVECVLGNGKDRWRIEALGQNVFDFGADRNHAHVQPGGEYHYHGLPIGLIENAGITEANKRMLLIGWANDGYPVYARYCYSDAMDATSPVKSCTGSFKIKAEPGKDRPSTNIMPMGVFAQDWEYKKGTGDLDDCNGRTGVTPEFPKGIYYYMATDTYPFFSRCLKGKISFE